MIYQTHTHRRTPPRSPLDRHIVILMAHADLHVRPFVIYIRKHTGDQNSTRKPADSLRRPWNLLILGFIAPAPTMSRPEPVGPKLHITPNLFEKDTCRTEPSNE